MTLLADLATSFVIGLLTPLTASCVIALYPAFIAYLANNLNKGDKKAFILVGLLIVLGVITFMFLLGLLFTFVFQASLTRIIGIVSPIAFGLMAIISLLLIFNVDFSRYMPAISTPTSRNPYKSSFLYGFFFGAIVIPCNPLLIAAFFTTAVGTIGFVSNMAAFLAFGLGIGLPLLALSILSGVMSKNVALFLARHKKTINVIAGIILLIISLYYLIFVFSVFG